MLSVPFGAPALAQTATPSPGGNDAAQRSASSPQVEEIVVTAQRRSERLQDVPIAVSAITGIAATAQGVTGTSVLQASVPSLVVARQANGAVPFLRGIGSTIGDGNAESSVAIYLDGVYQPSAFSNFFEFNNVERVEVLKGPQGTLFGRNATGGVIQVITKDPGDSPQGDFKVGYANYKTVTANGYVSLPIAQNLGFNLAALYQDQDEGWGENLSTGEKTRGARDIGVRAKLLFTPDAQTDIRLSADYSKTTNGGINAQPLPGARTLPFTGGLGYPGPFNTWVDHEFIGRSETKGASLHIDHDFDKAHLKSITAYQHSTGFYSVDGDMSPVPAITFDFDMTSKTFSQELHLLSRPTSKLQWLVGGYFYRREVSQLQEVRGLFTLPLTNGLDQAATTKVTSKSLFGQATYPLAEDTNLTVGLRYSWEKVAGSASDFLGGTSIGINPLNGQVQHLQYSKPTWRISLDHKFESNILGYVSYNRGIKSGNFGLSGSTAGMDEPYLPEQIDAYEVGLKTELFDRRVRLNTAVFAYDFKNYQFQKFINGASFVFNGPSARSYGGEVELEVRASDRLTLNGTIGLLHTRIGDFPGAPNACRSVATGVLDNGGFFCDPTTGLPTTTPYNAKGNRLPNAPKATGNVGFIYTMPTSNGDFRLAGNVYHFGGAPADVSNRLYYRKYTTISGSLTWTDRTEAFSVSLWGKNLTNEYYYAQQTALVGLIDLGGPAPPRTFGITLGYKFQ